RIARINPLPVAGRGEVTADRVRLPHHQIAVDYSGHQAVGVELEIFGILIAAERPTPVGALVWDVELGAAPQDLLHVRRTRTPPDLQHGTFLPDRAGDNNGAAVLAHATIPRQLIFYGPMEDRGELRQPAQPAFADNAVCDLNPPALGHSRQPPPDGRRGAERQFGGAFLGHREPGIQIDREARGDFEARIFEDVVAAPPAPFGHGLVAIAQQHRD